MIEVSSRSKEGLAGLLKRYKQKVDKIRLVKRKGAQLRFQSGSERRRKEIQKAIVRERYKRLHGLV